MNAPPPFCTAWTGNLKKFPNPTAFQAMAKISPTREPHDSVFVDIKIYWLLIFSKIRKLSKIQIKVTLYEIL
jgi:hypothetical protein